MDFYEVLEQVLTLLQRHGRVSYRALRRQFDLDEDYLEDLKLEIIKVQRLAVDEDGEMLVWTGNIEAPPVAAFQPDQTSEQPIAQEAQPTQVELPPTEPPTPDAERRQLTVMFSDLVDSTKLSGQLDPEDYREVLRAYQQACSDVIHRYDGYIAQHLGDALLVYFGFPQAHEDEAHRALYAGLGMLQAMKTLNERLEQEKGIRLSIRVGIHTGLTVVGDIGEGSKHEMLALGEAPNVASRIQGIAEPDTVVISEVTYRLIQGYFDCDDLGFHTLKGVTTPVQVYRVLGASGAQSRLDVAAIRGLTPLVGREQEVGLLLERWEYVKDGMGQVVLLSGEAGIGKSRLVQVLKDHIASLPHFRWECRCSPYYHNSAFYPVIDLFQRAFQFQRDDTPADKLRKMEETLLPYVSLPEVIPLFASMLLVPFDDRYPLLTLTPERQKQKTLEATLTLLLAVAAQQPLLFIMEDLHWIDPSTLQLFDLLLDQAPTAQLLTILTCRPAFQPTWSNRSYLTQVTLNRLSRNQIAHMAERVAGGKRLPAEVLLQIIEKTDGVPLFVEEMTKAVLESGLLKETDEHYELVGHFTSLTIPATLQDSLMARLDRLVTAKGVAQLGATIGRQFSYELLQAITPLDESTLRCELCRLVESELLYQRGLPPQETYVFKHALIQDVAYQSLLRSTRQPYHQRIAQVLEEEFPETVEMQPELLAYHYTEAGCNAQAIAYWQRAGENAFDRSAHVEAIGHLTQGLALLPSLQDSAARTARELALQTLLAPALVATKGPAAPEVEPAYARVRALCTQVGETAQLAPTLLGLFRFYSTRAQHQTAWELGEQLLRLTHDIPDSPQRTLAHYALGVTAMWCGEWAVARTHLEDCRALYEAQPHWKPDVHAGHDPNVACRIYGAWPLWALGYPEQARQRNEEGMALASGLPHPYSLAYARLISTMFYQVRREVHSLLQERTEAAITLCEEQGFGTYLAGAMILHGWVLATQGQHEEGITQIRQGLATWRTTGAELCVPHFLALLADACGNAGQTDEGLTMLTEAFTLVDNTGEEFYHAELHRLQGELLLAKSPDNQAEAETCFHQALALARNQEAKSWELRAATSLARLWQSQGKRQDASDLLAPVYEWFTEGFDTADLKDAKTLLDA